MHELAGEGSELGDFREHRFSHVIGVEENGRVLLQWGTEVHGDAAPRLSERFLGWVGEIGGHCKVAVRIGLPDEFDLLGVSEGIEGELDARFLTVVSLQVPGKHVRGEWYGRAVWCGCGRIVGCFRGLGFGRVGHGSLPEIHVPNILGKHIR